MRHNIFPMRHLSTTRPKDHLPNSGHRDLAACGMWRRLMIKLISRLAAGFKGFTLLELIMTIAILATLAAIGMSTYNYMIDEAKISRAVADIRNLQMQINTYELDYQKLPDSLADIGLENFRDPWDNPYQYTNFENTPKGKWRKDHNLVPLNTYYDLWSMGPDGDSKPPLTAKASRDDIVRGRDGTFIGPAEDY